MKRVWKGLSLMLCSALTISMGAYGVGAAQETSADDSETKSIVMGSLGYFPNSNWDAGTGYEGWYISSYGVAETLYKLDENFEAYPWLAESAKEVDSLTWSLEIRDGVTFTNGIPVTAEAVKKCFERNIANNDTTASLAISSIDADGQTLTIHLENSSINFLQEIANPTYWCVYDSEGSSDFAEESFFTGPYIPVSFSAYDKIELVKNENYWGEEPDFDEVTLLTVGDVDTLLMAYQNGEVDVVVPIPDESVESYRSLPNTEIASSLGGRAQFFRFNMNSETMKDIAVRNAISYCIDREGYADAICNGLVEPSYGVFSKNLSFGGTEGMELTVKNYDTNAAAELLESAGYQDSNGDGILEKDGIDLSVHIVAMSSQSTQVQLCQVLESELTRVGFSVKLDVVENINDVRSAGDFDLCCESYNVAGNGNPTSFINRMFATGGSTNYGGYSSEKVDSLIEEMNNAQDTETQNECVKKIGQEILNDCPFVFFAYKYFTAVYNTNTISNYISQPCEYYILDSSTKGV